MSDTVNTINLSPDKVIAQITAAGVSSRDAALIASAWIYQNLGQIQRTFSYGASFDAVDTHCVDAFAATFAHRDWVDGEDVVQAGVSATDEGFNSRFHKIQNDIASLGAEIAKIYACMADMRSNLAARLQEIATELNRIDSELPADVVRPPIPYTGILENTQFVGMSTIQDQSVSIWKTNTGMMILPGVMPLPSDPSVDPGVKNVGALSSFTSSADVQGAFGGKAFTIADFSAKYGNTILSNGAKVSDVVSTLPSTSQFASVNDMMTALGEQQATLLRSQVGVPEALAQSLNIRTIGTAFANADVGAVSSLTDQQKAALKAAGITNVGQLASADPRAVSDAFTKAGITNVAAGDIASLQSTAKIITRVR